MPADLRNFTDEELAQLAAGQTPGGASTSDTQGATPAAPPPPPLTTGQELRRTGGLVGRAGMEAIGGLPNMAMDIGVGARNLGGDLLERLSIGGRPVKESTPDYEYPSQMYEEQLDQLGFPRPQGFGEVLPSMGISALLSGKLPGGGAPEEMTPANFENPATTSARLRADILKNAQGDGFVVPPSTTNPTLRNRLIETIAGKQNTEQWARIINDRVRQASGNKALGFNPDTPLTRESMQAVMDDAGDAYEQGRAVPLFKTSQEYLDRMTQIAHENQGANESFPGAASPDVAKVVDTYLQPTMTGSAAVSAVKLLRQKASDAFDQGNSELGRVYRQVQAAIEDELERGAQLKDMPGTVGNLQKARTQYAKAATIRDAMEPDGTITGDGLRRAWANNPNVMSGDLKTASEFAAQYPKANISSSKTGSPVHHLSSLEGMVPGGLTLEHMISGGHGIGGTALATAAATAAIPVTRRLARAYLFSKRGQAGAVPAAAQPASPYNFQFTPAQYAAGLQSMNSQ